MTCIDDNIKKARFSYLFTQFLDILIELIVYQMLLPLMEENLERLAEDVSWMVEMFDYRNQNADWKNSAEVIILIIYGRCKNAKNHNFGQQHNRYFLKKMKNYS